MKIFNGHRSEELFGCYCDVCGRLVLLPLEAMGDEWLCVSCIEGENTVCVPNGCDFLKKPIKE